MSNENTNMIDAVLEDDPKTFMKLFEEKMEIKTTSLLEAYKAFVAAKIFDTSADEGEVVGEETELAE